MLIRPSGLGTSNSASRTCQPVWVGFGLYEGFWFGYVVAVQAGHASLCGWVQGSIRVFGLHMSKQCKQDMPACVGGVSLRVEFCNSIAESRAVMWVCTVGVAHISCTWMHVWGLMYGCNLFYPSYVVYIGLRMMLTTIINCFSCFWIIVWRALFVLRDETGKGIQAAVVSCCNWSRHCCMAHSTCCMAAARLSLCMWGMLFCGELRCVVHTIYS